MSRQSIYDQIPPTNAPISYGRKLIKWTDVDVWNRDQRKKLLYLDLEQRMLADTYLGIAAVLPYELQLDILERVIGTQKQAVEMKKMSSQATLEKVALDSLRLIPPESSEDVESSSSSNEQDVEAAEVDFLPPLRRLEQTLTRGFEIDFFIAKKKNHNTWVHQDAHESLFGKGKDLSCAAFPSLQTLYLVAEHVSTDFQAGHDWRQEDPVGLPGLVDFVPAAMQLLKHVSAKKYVVVVGGDDIWKDAVRTIHHKVEAPTRYADLVKTSECLNGEAFETPEKKLMDDKHMNGESRKACLMKWRDGDEWLRA